MLADIAVDYDVLIQDVRPMGPHLQVEFYATRRDNHTPLNATRAYQKLTKLGQDFYYPNSKFHFVKITMKGDGWVGGAGILVLFICCYCCLQYASFLVPAMGHVTVRLTSASVHGIGWKTCSRHSLASRRQTAVRAGSPTN